MATKKANNETLDFISVSQGRFRAYLLGESPIILNTMSQKAKQELLGPKGRKTAAEKAMSLKHDPVQEFRDSINYARLPDAPTLITHLPSAFKRSMMGAALDIPGAKKAQIGRLVYVENPEVYIYGIPELMMSVTRSADINKTPDVRTRAIIPVWCAVIDVCYTEPMLKGETVSKLLAAGGIMQGVGDWRPEKGSGNYGRYRLAEADDPQVKLIMETGGREAQRAAIDNPTTFDSETESLLDWFSVEMRRRGFKIAN